MHLGQVARERVEQVGLKFLFSSRRRHTRLVSDWSSDVCSSDLNQQKNKIISILSHDVASPLNTLSGLLHLQAKGQISESEFRPFLTQIGDQLHNVTGLRSEERRVGKECRCREWGYR